MAAMGGRLSGGRHASSLYDHVKVLRYGAAKQPKRDDWNCPKCRGICNCSDCRKKKGQKPTGALARVAKAIGYTSVHDLLEKGPEAVAAAQALRRSLKKRTPRYRVNNTFVEGRPHLLRDESTDASEGNIVQPNRSPVFNIAGAQLADQDAIMGARDDLDRFGPQYA
ncbi:hypothetical protein HU200_013867 [Digitaria exilis]|uniref:Zinc-finger domain-containing protein n=1 Tax=Digitaria exilis TaxID=1010633 RepID=A0A835FDT0_9POAL|nr:hypothetical protein HU200_013867 [Digitaria exilis]